MYTYEEISNFLSSKGIKFTSKNGSITISNYDDIDSLPKDERSALTEMLFNQKPVTQRISSSETVVGCSLLAFTAYAYIKWCLK